MIAVLRSWWIGLARGGLWRDASSRRENRGHGSARRANWRRALGRSEYWRHALASQQYWWRGFSRRERKMIAAALTLVTIALLYLVAIEPAWVARARLVRELPRLQEQMAELEALREEARLLKQQGFGSDTGGSLRASAERSLARAGVTAQLRAEGQGSIFVSAAGVPAQVWFTWMEEFARESRVRVTRARITRGTVPGMVEAEAGFELPAR